MRKHMLRIKLQTEAQRRNVYILAFIGKAMPPTQLCQKATREIFHTDTVTNPFRPTAASRCPPCHSTALVSRSHCYQCYLR